MKVVVDYPTGEEEREIVYRMGVQPPVAEQVLSPADLLRLQEAAEHVFVHHALVDYVVRLVLVHPRRRPTTAWPTSPAGSRTAPARAPRSA